MPKVLHLFANHKITGPAELALETARALLARGVDASFYSSDFKKPNPTRDRWLQQLARERGIPEPDLQGVNLGKHLSPLRAFLDVRKLADHLRQHPPDVIHCHLPNDHLLAGYALRRVKRSIPLVRSLYDGTPPEVTRRSRLTLGSMTSRLICFSQHVADTLRERAASYRLNSSLVRHLDPPIDVERFDPGRGLVPRRQELGLPENAFCLGIVARMQTHRRFELLLEAIRQARQRVPNLHLVVVGRGTNQEVVAKEPSRRLGLSDCVHFAGYVSGEDYVATLAAFDAKIFLVPGSDGTCRAVREALAMGIPILATRQGMLPELVRDQQDGLLIDESIESLVEGIASLSEPERRNRMAKNARTGAVERFSFGKFAASLEAIYAEVLEETTASQAEAS